MKFLFIHPNMPGQYKHLVRTFADQPEHEVVFITKPSKVQIEGVKKIEYKVSRQAQPETHKYLLSLEKYIYSAQEVWRVCQALKTQGFEPDIVCAHPGWGDTLLLRDFYKDIPFLYFMEFYYHAHGSDSNFLNKEPTSHDEAAQIRFKNSLHLMNAEACDLAISPTHFQAQKHPPEFLSKFSIIHDGIDTETIQPSEKNDLTLPNGKVIKAKTPLITYVTRNIEPYRGFPTFIKAIELILKKNPDVEVLVIGGDGSGYGKSAPKGTSHKEIAMQGLDLDFERVHFFGKVPYPYYLKVLQASSLHMYLTVPFVLSWSLLESMAAGCCVLASDTEPVREVIQDQKNGCLVDFFDHEGFAHKALELLSHKDLADQLKTKARETIMKHYALKDLLPLHIELIETLAKKECTKKILKKIKTRSNSIKRHLGGKS